MCVKRTPGAGFKKISWPIRSDIINNVCSSKSTTTAAAKMTRKGNPEKSLYIHTYIGIVSQMYACKDIFISNAVWLLLLLCLYTMKINIYKEQNRRRKISWEIQLSLGSHKQFYFIPLFLYF